MHAISRRDEKVNAGFNNPPRSTVRRQGTEMEKAAVEAAERTQTTSQTRDVRH